MFDAGEYEAKLQKRLKAREAAARRAPPMREDIPAGHCRWCGRAVLFPLGRKRAGEVNLRASWHSRCAAWYKLAAWQSELRDAVWERDHGKCGLCGTVAPFNRVTAYRPVSQEPDWQVQRYIGFDQMGEWRGLLFCPLEPIIRTDWHADHIVPLWSIRGEALEKRGCFFGLANLWTLCDGCHKIKTKREARLRASMKSSAVL